MATVAVDNEAVGEVDGGSYLMVQIPPGRHTIAAITSHHLNELSLDLLPDSSAILQLHWKKMSWTRQATLTIDTAVATHERLRAGHMVASSWPGTLLGAAR